MLKGDDIKRLIKSAKNRQVEFKLAKGGAPDTPWESVLVHHGPTNGGEWVFMI